MTDAVLATSLSTPIGDLALLVRDDVLVAAGFSSIDDQYARLHTDAALRRVSDLGRFSAAMTAYFDGDATAMDVLPVEQPGGAFRQAAWKVMREVPAGEVITYAELAARAGNPGAVRAAGSACAQNMVAPIVPCHRIVRTGGSLGGYYYGLSVKQWLLAHEKGEVGPVQGELLPLHGATVNGATVNGATVNGATVNGATVNGATVNGATVSAAG